MRVVFIVHYYPPINSSGAKRIEALSKYLVAMGHHITVVTTQKRLSDGEFTETVPVGVEVIELDALGRERPSYAGGATFEPMYAGAPSWKRSVKDTVMRVLGQLPDPRLPFAFSFLSPWLAQRAREALRKAEVVVGSTPPWPMLLAALIAKWRFRVPCILDYRDQFSECHEMPGSPMAKLLETKIDARLVKAADHVVAISDPMADYYRSMTDRVTAIPNGYDHEVLEAARRSAIPTSGGQIVVRYMGLVSPGRIPHRFLEALSVFQQERPERFRRLCIEFYGNAALVEQALVDRYAGIGTAFHFYPMVPYCASMQRIVEADYLLFSETSSTATLSAQGILTTKLFEYIGSGRPVLADISPHTLAGGLLRRCGTGHIVGDTSEVFLQALRSDAFYVRLPDETSALSMGLSREAQAKQYALLATDVVDRS